MLGSVPDSPNQTVDEPLQIGPVGKETVYVCLTPAFHQHWWIEELYAER